jgi:hypothetical protein
VKQLQKKYLQGQELNLQPRGEDSQKSHSTTIEPKTLEISLAMPPLYLLLEPN